MRINCLSCGHRVDLDNAYGDYAGQVKCLVCDTMLDIKTEEGNVKSVVVARGTEWPSPGHARLDPLAAGAHPGPRGGGE